MAISDLGVFYARTQRPETWDHLIASIASLVYKSLESFANSFNGVDDRNWSYAITVIMDIFPRHGDVGVGLNPLQQHLALWLIDKLKQNMQGFYPAISRVLLAVIGPYERDQQVSELSAFGLLRDAVYGELKKNSRI